MPWVDREHTTHFESCGCAEAKVERLEAEAVAQVELTLDLYKRLEALADPLKMLERLAREYGLPAQVESLLRVYESDGTMRYQDEFSHRNITREEAAALLKGDTHDAND